VLDCSAGGGDVVEREPLADGDVQAPLEESVGEFLSGEGF
jgi:hypothetical protein